MRVLLFHVEPQPGGGTRHGVLGETLPGPRLHPAQQPGADPAALPRRVDAAVPVRLVAVRVLGDPAVRPGDALRVEAEDGVRRGRVLLRLEDLFQVGAALKPDGLFDGGRPGDQRRPAVEVRGPGGPPLQAGVQAGRGASGVRSWQQANVRPTPAPATALAPAHGAAAAAAARSRSSRLSSGEMSSGLWVTSTTCGPAGRAGVRPASPGRTPHPGGPWVRPAGSRPPRSGACGPRRGAAVRRR